MHETKLLASNANFKIFMCIHEIIVSLHYEEFKYSWKLKMNESLCLMML